MMKVIKYSAFVLLIVAFTAVGLFFYLKKDDYQIVFDSNGGSYVETISTGILNKIEKPDDPIREGYVFAGWYLEDEKFSFDTKLDNNITLTAQWEKNEQVTYILNFDSLGGNAISSIEVEEGEVLKNVPIPKKDGYEFICWCYHNKEFDFRNKIEENMVLVAKYARKEDVVTVTFKYNNGLLDVKKKVSIGSLLTNVSNPVWKGHKFMGWYLDDQEYSFAKPIEKDIILNARWEEIE